MKEDQNVYYMEIEPKTFVDAATRGGTSITNLDKLIEAVGSKTVDYMFTEYMMRQAAKAVLLDKIEKAIASGADVQKVKELLNGTDSNGGISFPWNDIILYEDSPCVKHRGISIRDYEPVVGYVWAGADHVYITPDNLGVDYDDDTGRITACAIEVIRDTVAAQLPLMDDEHTQLYAGDVIKVGDRLVTLKPFDKEVVESLSMPEYRKHIHRVKTNYER